MKAAAFPLHFWLPASYPTPRIVVAALFAGLLTKVGVYSLLRVLVMLFGDEGAMFMPLLGWLGILTGILGALGALAQTDLRRMAAFLVVSGVGVMLIGFGLGSAEGLSGTIVYAVHSIFVMTALFLVVGVVERLGGGAGLAAGSGLYASHTLLAGLFLVFGFSAAGLPPFSGFWPKLILVDAALANGNATAIAGAVGVILSGILTTIAVGRAWALVFLKPRANDPAERDGADAAVASPRAAFAFPLVLLGGIVIALGVFPAIVVGPAETGAAGLLDPSGYLERVLGQE
jgi:multicomponent Na+:H+ antiporter subunit D